MKIIRNPKTDKWDVYSFGSGTGVFIREGSFRTRREAGEFVKNQMKTA